MIALENTGRCCLGTTRLPCHRVIANPLCWDAMNTADRFLSSVDNALRTVVGAVHASRPLPAVAPEGETLDPAAMRLSGALMRVNHVGEVCAQALYQAQALTARTQELRQQMERAAREETDHLAWTQQRLDELGDRRSWLNPLWYAGAFGVGLLAGRLGDRASLGFVVETERQVEQHLASHLDRLPEADERSRAIVQIMKDDEARHADEALDAGAMILPAPVRWLMRGAARVMTTTAHYV
jgi:ubiquinone biosynthesis monooxygenase Coq7